jgi:hypothetical protein
MRRLPFLLPLLAVVFALAACAEPPPPERQSAEAKKASEHHELRDTIQTPIDKAKGVDAVQEKQAEDQKAAIDDQGG